MADKFFCPNGGNPKLHPPSNFGNRRDSGAYPYNFVVKDFNSVDPGFVRYSVLSKIKMADKKSEATEKLAAHDRKV
jgi:hypothetical protein